jgi:hypothetical protein
MAECFEVAGYGLETESKPGGKFATLFLYESNGVKVEALQLIGDERPKLSDADGRSRSKNHPAGESRRTVRASGEYCRAAGIRARWDVVEGDPQLGS